MAGVNKVILLGNLGKDPEVRHLEGGATVATFTLATSESYKDKMTGERKTQTEWHNIVMWRGLAEIAEKYLRKGNQVYIEGKLSNRSYEDKEGNRRYVTEIVAREMTMLGGASSSGNSEYAQTTQSPMNTQVNTVNTPVATASNPAVAESSANEIDDLPF